MHLERNGNYWRAVWFDHLGHKRTKGLGNVQKVSKRAAQTALKQLIADHAVNPARGRAPTLEALVRDYLEVNDLSPSTRDLYDQTATVLYDHFGKSCRVDKIRPADADKWRKWLRSRKGGHNARGDTISEATVAKHIRHTRAIFNMAVRHEVLNRNPFAGLSGAAPKVSRAAAPIDESVIDGVLDACINSGWRCLVALCGYGGLRRGEALRLEWGDIQWDRRRLIVRDGKHEGSGRCREVMMEPALEAVLLEDQERASPTEGVLANNLNTNMIRAIRRAGHKPWSRPFHALRDWRDRTWKMRYPEFVVDSWLGHSMEVSRKFYLSVPEAYYETVTNPTPKSGETTKVS